MIALTLGSIYGVGSPSPARDARDLSPPGRGGLRLTGAPKLHGDIKLEVDVDPQGFL
jgi:hypothetical protein